MCLYHLYLGSCRLSLKPMLENPQIASQSNRSWDVSPTALITLATSCQGSGFCLGRNWIVKRTIPSYRFVLKLLEKPPKIQWFIILLHQALKSLSHGQTWDEWGMLSIPYWKSKLGCTTPHRLMIIPPNESIELLTMAHMGLSENVAPHSIPSCSLILSQWPCCMA